MNRLPVLSEATMAKALEMMRMAEAQAYEHIVLIRVTDANEVEHHVIRDRLAGPVPEAILYQVLVDPPGGSQAKAEAKLDELRRRRVILAIVGSLPL